MVVCMISKKNTKKEDLVHVRIYKSCTALDGTCSQSQGDPTRVNSDDNRALAVDGKSSINLASHGHCARVFIGT
jgi:hypothetical protein